MKENATDNHFSEITSKRLILRPWRESEAQDFFELTQDPGFGLFPITIYKQTDLASSRAWIKENLLLQAQSSLGKWGVWEKQTRTLIGMGGLTPWNFEGEALVDITYRLCASAWGKGFGGELAQTLAHHAFGTMELREITATITPDNEPSKKIAEKLGMSFERKITLLGVATDLYRLPREKFLSQSN